MFRILNFGLLASLIPFSAIAGTGALPDVSQNPHVLFLKSWLAEAKSPERHAGPDIRFRFANHLANAVRDQDRRLVRMLVPLYSDALASEIQLTQLELSAKRQLADRARQIADQLHALVALLGERPAAGTLGQIERETLAAATLPFEAAAAESLAKLPLLRRRLDLLGAKQEPSASQIPDQPAPFATDAPTLAASSSALRIVDILAERQLATMEPLDDRMLILAPVFTEGDSAPANTLTKLGRQDRFSPKRRADFHDQALLALTEAIQRRLDALAAIQPLVQAFPEDKLARMIAAAELADRQYRQGALPIGLLIETQKAVFEAQSTRTNALLNFWRETLELRSLVPGSTP